MILIHLNQLFVQVVAESTDLRSIVIVIVPVFHHFVDFLLILR